MKIWIALACAALVFLGSNADAQTPAGPVPLSSPSPMLPAGVVPPAVTVELAGTVTPAFAYAKIRAAIDALAQRQPGAVLEIHGITISAPLVPGSSLDALAGVALEGRGAYADVNGKTEVHVSVADVAPFEPSVLAYSDDPEYVGPADDGVLFRATIAPAAPARLFLYHVAAIAPRRIGLVLTTDGTPARVESVGTSVGPSSQYAYVGQQATARFLLEHAHAEGTMLDVAPGAPLEIPLATLQPGDLIETIADLRVVSGGPVTVAVVTLAGTAPLASVASGPELAGDSHNRRGVYSLAAIAPFELTLAANAAAPANPVTVGVTPLENARPGGRVLAGDYGIARRFALHLTNPTDRLATIYLYERTLGGGGATVTLLFDGEDAPTLVPCVNDAVQPRLVRAFDLAPGAAQTIAGTYMTDGASSYPIEFGLTATPPLAVPPGGCAASPNA